MKPIAEVARVPLRHRIGAVPVVEGDGEGDAIIQKVFTTSARG